MGKAKTSPDQVTPGKHHFDLFRCGIGSHVKILWHFSQQQVPDAAPDNICFIACFLQATNNLSGSWAKLLNRKTMSRGGDKVGIVDNKILKLVSGNIIAGIYIESEADASLPCASI